MSEGAAMVPFRDLSSRLLVAALLCGGPAAFAESFEVLGRKIEIEPPQGFCVLGDSKAEQVNLDLHRRNAMDSILAHYSVPCDELTKFRARKLNRFTRWAMVHLPKMGGGPWVVTQPRGDFLRERAREMAVEGVDLAEFNSRLETHLSRSGVSASVQGMTPVGVKGDALFVVIQGANEVGGARVRNTGMTALTVVRGIALTATVYASENASRESLEIRAMSFVDRIVALNL
jgi:hypothetical protein